MRASGDLRIHGECVALVAPDGTATTYRELVDRADEIALRVAGGRDDRRRLVLLEAENTVDAVTTYVACLTGRHPVIVAAPGTAAALVERYDPDVVAGRTA